MCVVCCMIQPSVYLLYSTWTHDVTVCAGICCHFIRYFSVVKWKKKTLRGKNRVSSPEFLTTSPRRCRWFYVKARCFWCKYNLLIFRFLLMLAGCLRPVFELFFYFCAMPSVLWCYWLGGRKGICPVKNWVVGCWHGYLSRVRCRFACGPADATATHYLLLQ